LWVLEAKGWLHVAFPPELVLSLALSAGPITSYVGTTNGIYASTGVSGPYRQLLFPSFEVHGIAVDSRNPDVVWASSRGGFWLSVDGGGNWTPESAGIRNPTGAWAIAFFQGSLIASDSEAVYRWNGARWTQSSSQRFVVALDGSADGGRLFASSMGQGIESFDGHTWTKSDAGLAGHGGGGAIHVVAVTDTLGSRAYAATMLDGVAVTTDGGHNWSPVRAGLPMGGPPPLIQRAAGSYDALGEADVVSICVATPLGPGQTPDFSPLGAIAAEIAARLRAGQLVILESGTYPGTTREVLLPALARSSPAAGEEYFVAPSPERVDPGNTAFAVANTARVVSGATPACIELACAFYRATVGAVVPVHDIAVAELTKVFENTFRAVNVALVNELAILCDRMGVDVWDVVDAASTKPFGMMRFEPGPGVGGSGVPHDLQYLAWQARRHHAPAPLLEGARGSLARACDEDGLRGVADPTVGAIVSCSALGSFESMVAAALRSRAPPQVEQNRPLEETCAPQEEQYMGGEILPLREGPLRTAPRSPDKNYEMRST